MYIFGQAQRLKRTDLVRTAIELAQLRKSRNRVQRADLVMRAVQRLKLPIQRREIFDSILSTIKGVQHLQRAQRLKTFNLVIVAIKPEEIRRLDRFEGRNAVFSTVKCRKLLQFPQGFQASELVLVTVQLPKLLHSPQGIQTSELVIVAVEVLERMNAAQRADFR